MVPITGIINGSAKIAEFFGLVEGVSTQVTKLVHQAFKSAKHNLENAQYASGQNQIDYIKRAKDCFIDAVAVEENENKILSLVGLSMCQYLLGDKINAERSLCRIKSVELTRAEITKYTAAQAVKFGLIPFSQLASKFLTGELSPSLKERIERFEKARNDAISINKTLLT